MCVCGFSGPGLITDIITALHQHGYYHKPRTSTTSSGGKTIAASSSSSVRVVGIGGINEGNCGVVVEAGADGVGVIQCVSSGGPQGAKAIATTLRHLVEEAYHSSSSRTPSGTSSTASSSRHPQGGEL